MSDAGAGVGEMVRRVHIVDISPPPPEDEMVAIAVALDQAWPEPQAPSSATTADDAQWRFASRPWQRPAIPVRRWSK